MSNQKDGSLKSFFFKLWSKQKYAALILIALTVISSFLEVISLTAILPLAAIILGHSDNQTVLFALKWLGEIFTFATPSTVLVILTCLAIFFSFAIRVLLLFVQTRLAASCGNQICGGVFSAILDRPYSYFLENNSNEFMASLLGRVDTVISSIIFSVLRIFSSTIIAIAVLSILYNLAPLFLVPSVLTIAVVYLIIHQSLKQKVSNLGLTLNDQRGLVVKHLNEGFGAIKDIKLSGANVFFIDQLVKTDWRVRDSLAKLQFLGTLPKYLIEASLMIGIIILVFGVSRYHSDGREIVGQLAVFAYGLQRLAPLGQEIFASIIKLRGGAPALLTVVNEWQLSGNNHIAEESLKPKHKNSLISVGDIKLKDVGFSYGRANEFVFENVNLTIKRGEKVGIIGPSGSGKSTLLDILIGLLPISKGSHSVGYLEFEGLRSSVDWLSNIAHVPQNPFLFDASLEQNICIGQKHQQVDSLKLQKVIEIAALTELKNEVKGEKLGENGARLSGGQRQRVAIARALYSDGDILVLDEATSAMDKKTERSVLKNLIGYNSDFTLIIVSHDVEVVSFCDYFFVVADSKIAKRRKPETK